jgi:NAD(P)-dependent dehydrogenase (short-subunit alcohol dehydrogenase family)
MSERKIWLITGAGRGIGVDIAKAAADPKEQIHACSTTRNGLFHATPSSAVVSAAPDGGELLGQGAAEGRHEREEA